MVEEKEIQNQKVRRSTKHPNYGCSKEGVVYRWDRETPMKVSLGKDYYVFRVSFKGKATHGFYHVILAECWLYNDDPKNKIEVNHLDGNKLNCSLDNLEWVTKAQNQRHAVSTGLKASGELLYNTVLTEDAVHNICKHLVDGWLIKDIADKYEVSKDIIRKIRAGDTWFHVRVLYEIPHTYKSDFSTSTVKWVCEQIISGVSDKNVSNTSRNKKLTTIDVKRIRHKIRYKIISDEFF